MNEKTLDPSELIFQRSNFNKAATIDYKYPLDKFNGRGIVICAGGAKYFTCAWVCINMLRKLGCNLPIELWHLGPRELTDEMKALVEPLNVVCVDGRACAETVPARRLNGWELKPYAIINSTFKEVLLLDSDNVPVVNPEYLFETDRYKTTGAIFWPDFNRLANFRLIWDICEITYQDEPEFETGQIVVNKEKCWNELQLTMYMNEYSDFFYHYIHGDKETFHMAWRKLNSEYAMPTRPIDQLKYTMCQHDFNGTRVFQHRNMAKWKLNDNPDITGFLYQTECNNYISELRAAWKILLIAKLPIETIKLYNQLVEQRFFQYTREGYDIRLIELLDNFEIGDGNARMEQSWMITLIGNKPFVEIKGALGTTCVLQHVSELTFKGSWLNFEKMPITLSAII